MTIEHAVEIALIIFPTIIFIVLLFLYATRKGQLPAKEVGGILAYRSFEGVTSIALLLSMALLPELVVKVGEFRGMVAVLAAVAGWSAFHAIYSQVK